MKVPAEIFRAYDIRGVVGRTLTAEIVREIGRALGSLAMERKAPTFAVGRDGRLSGPEFVDALIAGITAAGAHAVDIGMAPTPVVYFAAHHLGCGSCVAVSGSHNPPQYNGLKMVVAGTTLYGDDIQQLLRDSMLASGARVAGPAQPGRWPMRIHRLRNKAGPLAYAETGGQSTSPNAQVLSHQRSQRRLDLTAPAVVGLRPQDASRMLLGRPLHLRGTSN